MKIGILSDTHEEFGVQHFLKKEAGVFYIHAGDIHPDPIKRDRIIAKNKYDFTVLGNHDYWYGDFQRHDGRKMVEVDGIRIAGATLWSDLSSPVNWLTYYNESNDNRYIKGMTEELYNQKHREDKKFLLESGADVIVSHMAPSFESVPAERKGSILNYAYATELYYDILGMKHPPKLWIHGHMHNDIRYKIGETTVICHPRGYPGIGDPVAYRAYGPLIVELKEL